MVRIRNQIHEEKPVELQQRQNMGSVVLTRAAAAAGFLSATI